MTTSRRQQSEAPTNGDPTGNGPARDPPQLNCYEIHAERTVVTEPGNTGGWIATDKTVDLSE